MSRAMMYVRELGIISTNETYHEHPPSSLKYVCMYVCMFALFVFIYFFFFLIHIRYVLISAYLGELHMRSYAPADDANRDAARIASLRISNVCMYVCMYVSSCHSFLGFLS